MIRKRSRPFEQVEDSRTRAHGGTGLGLPYAVKLAELHLQPFRSRKMRAPVPESAPPAAVVTPKPKPLIPAPRGGRHGVDDAA